MPGTNHCRAEPPSTSGSSGANSARKTSGWTMLMMIVNGLRRIGRSSRLKTVLVSVTSEVMTQTSTSSLACVGRFGSGAALAQAAAGQL